MVALHLTRILEAILPVHTIQQWPPHRSILPANTPPMRQMFSSVLQYKQLWEATHEGVRAPRRPAGRPVIWIPLGARQGGRLQIGVRGASHGMDAFGANPTRKATKHTSAVCCPPHHSLLSSVREMPPFHIISYTFYIFYMSRICSGVCTCSKPVTSFLQPTLHSKENAAAL